MVITILLIVLRLAAKRNIMRAAAAVGTEILLRVCTTTVGTYDIM